MNERPELDRQLDSAVFREYYYLKEELVRFCHENGLPTSGGKQELTERIAHYLETGKVLPSAPKPKKSGAPAEITGDSIIEENFACTEKHRAFAPKSTVRFSSRSSARAFRSMFRSRNG